MGSLPVKEKHLRTALTAFTGITGLRTMWGAGRVDQRKSEFYGVFIMARPRYSFGVQPTNSLNILV